MNLLGRELLSAINGSVAYAEKSGTTVVLLSNGEGGYVYRNKLAGATSVEGWKPVGYVSSTGGFLLTADWQAAAYKR